MPVTAKLSREFYEKLGDKIADELVNWFNAVDATYRSDLKELNERNFARFVAKMNQRFAESDARWEHRLAELEIKWEHRTADLEVRWTGQIADLKTSLIKWMFVFWVRTTVTVLGTTLAILKL